MTSGTNDNLSTRSIMASAVKLYDRLIDWDLMALSAQLGYIMPLNSMLELKNWN